MQKIIVGMSGGVDSFVTALLLQREGYDVIGVTLELWEKNDMTEVETICRSLGIPLICRDGREIFRQMVVRPFIDAYLAGLTPSPCCTCNSCIKWELLRWVAVEWGAERIATGHYVRITQSNGYYYICKGTDPHKDQSYFLWGVPQQILAMVQTPLGNYTKAEVKDWAIANGYPQMAAKRESMGICFLKGGDYRDFIRQNAGKTGGQQQGHILNREGKIIGEHSGLLNYTVGQKRGIPSCDGQPLYVAEINTLQNTIVADVKSGLCTMTIEVEQVKIVCREDLLADDVEVKIRGLGLNPQGFVRLEELPDNCLRIHLATPAWAVAPGQPVAFFRGERVVGGGKAKT